MAFHPGYNAKTSPGQFSSKAGGAFGPRIVRTGRWYVRGIEARNWSKLLAERRRVPFRNAMLAACRRGASKLF
jgi:hypothetical protein